MWRCFPLQGIIQLNCDASMSELWTRFLGDFSSQFCWDSLILCALCYFYVTNFKFYEVFCHIFSPCSYLKSKYTTRWLFFWSFMSFASLTYLQIYNSLNFSLEINTKSILCINYDFVINYFAIDWPMWCKTLLYINENIKQVEGIKSASTLA